MRHLIFVTVLLLVVVAGVFAVRWGLEQARPELPVNSRMGGDTVLTSHEGEPFDTTSLRGELVLLFFGYTHCPDVCPASLAKMSQVWKALDEDGHGDELRVVFVTFDPERDTPARLAEYVPFFGPRVVGLTGDVEQIREYALKYGVIFQKEPRASSGEAGAEGDAAPSDFVHSDYVYLLDRQGRVRKLYPADGDIEEMVRDVESLL